MLIKKDTIPNLLFSVKKNREAGHIERVRDLKILKKLQIINKNSSVLEIGCGDGSFMEVLQQEFECKIIGLDIANRALSIAKQKGLRVRKWDIEKPFPFPKNSFDLIISRQVIEHIYDPDSMLDNVGKVLKKEGTLFLTTPNLSAWFNRLILLLGFQPFYTEISTRDKTLGLSFTKKFTPNRQPIGHIRVFTAKALEDFIKFHNFKITFKKGAGVSYFPSWFRIINKFFENFYSLAPDLIICFVMKNGEKVKKSEAKVF